MSEGKINTRVFGVDPEGIEQAAQMIREGKLVAFPTETVYGLGADALNEEAVAKVYEAKGRPSDNPMIVHVATIDQLIKLSSQKISGEITKLIKIFWPGPLTIVVKSNSVIPKITTGGLDTVAVRMPSNRTALALISEAGTPIAAPSANISGRPSPTTFSHVLDDLDEKIDGIIAGEPCKVGIESTVLDMTGEIPTILRPGIVTREEISNALGREVKFDEALLARHNPSGDGEGLLEFDDGTKPKSPGMKYKHYAPKAHMIIYKGDPDKVAFAMADERASRIKMGEKVETLIFDSNNPEEAAHEFFSKLRTCDKVGVDVILAAAMEEEGVGFAVMNRMFKSAGYNIVEV